MLMLKLLFQFETGTIYLSLKKGCKLMRPVVFEKMAFQAETGPCHSAQHAGFGPFSPGISACPSRARAATPSFLTSRKETISWPTKIIHCTHVTIRPITSALAGVVQVCSGRCLPLLRWAFSSSSAPLAGARPESNIPVAQAQTLSLWSLNPLPSRRKAPRSSNKTNTHATTAGGRLLASAFVVCASLTPSKGMAPC